MVLWQEGQLISEEKEKLGFGFKLKIFFRYGVTDWNFYNKKDISKIITTFQAMYYGEKRSELSAEISDIEEYLNNVNKDLLSNYLDFSEPQALEKLNSLKNIRIKMYDTNSAKNGFHTKGYIFKEEEVYRIIIGSSNMTSAALTTNREWNTKLVSTSQGEVAEDILKEFDELWNSEYALDYDVFYEEYKQRYEIIKEQRKIATERNVTSLERYKLKPNSMQVRFITNLKNILQKDEKRALLISLREREKRMLLRLLCVNLDLNVSYLLCIERHWQSRRRSLIRECLVTQFRWDWLVPVIMNMIKIMYLRL